jgi:hypothetical protein
MDQQLHRKMAKRDSQNSLSKVRKRVAAAEFPVDLAVFSLLTYLTFSCTGASVTGKKNP